MLRSWLRVVAVVSALCALPTAARALPGDAAAVLAHCGPASDDQISRPSNGPAERVLTYNSLALRFQPTGGDWSYAAASDSGVPLPQSDLLKRMPCVSDALEEMAARPPGEAPAETPTEGHAPAIPTDDLFLFLGAVVICGIVFFAVRPYMKAEPKKRMPTEVPRSPTRRPSASGVKAWPRKPDDPPSSGTRRATQAAVEPSEEPEPPMLDGHDPHQGHEPHPDEEK